MEFGFDRERLPLAARMRPRTMDEFVGQDHIVGPGRLLRRAIEADQLQSILLSGPPGTGKTTLARVIAARTRSQFLSINAVLSGVKDIRQAIEDAREFSDRTNRRTLLFVDEVHRWNKSQQDALLPWVESGLFVLIGATTENPFFEVNRALLSRSRVFLLTPLTRDDLDRVLVIALTDRERGYGNFVVTIDEDARKHLIDTASGDARTLLNALELAVETSVDTFPPPSGTEIHITLAIAEESIQRRAVLYDKDGDYHFDTISAFIKSVRGSDPDAALYWLARMITAGEDPRYILRRLLILAAEDVGLADPNAITVVTGCAAAFDRVGLPEGQFHLAEATLYCATAPKSNSALAYFDALKAVQEAHNDEVPVHLRDASRDGADLGHGRDYLYPHAYRDHWVAQKYLPDSLQGNVFYQPGSQGYEAEQRTVIDERRRLQLAAESEQSWSIYVAKPAATRADHWLRRIDEAVLEETALLRDQVVRRMDVRPTDRVLLCGAPLQLFLWEILRRINGGLVAVWSGDKADIQAIQHLIDQSPLPEMERPQTIGPVPLGDPSIVETAASQGHHAGPFDKILCRPVPGVGATQRNTGAILRTLLPLRAPGGELLVLEIVPEEGTRPSMVLRIPDNLRSLLSAAEEKLFSSPRDSWEAALAEENVNESARFTRFETTVQRTINERTVRSWFDPEQPLGEAVRTAAGPSVLADLRSSAIPPESGVIQWRRVFLALTIRTDEKETS